MEEKLKVEILAARAGSSPSFTFVFRKYTPIVLFYRKKYYLHDFEMEDWLQEGRIVCFRSIQSYIFEGDKTFGSYFKMNFERHVFSLLRRQSAQKRRIDIHSISLETQTLHGFELLQMAEDKQAQLGLEGIIIRDTLKDFQGYLSSLEQAVFAKKIMGQDIYEIALSIQCSPYQARNALDRIRKKLINHLK